MTFAELVNTTSMAIAQLWFAGLSLAVVVSDVGWRRIPNRVVLPALLGLPVLFTAPLVSALLQLAASEVEPRLQKLLHGIEGALVLFAAYLVLACLGGVGGGDVKLAAVLGLVLGYFGGWGAVTVATVLAWSAAGTWIPLSRLVRRRAHGGSRGPPNLPFAPFLIGGAWVALLAY